MDPRDYIKLLLRRWKEILACGLLFLVLSGLFTIFFAETKYKSTIFFTVASEKYGNTLYDDMRGDDLFSESVQGWTKNPGVIEEISSRTDETFGITGRVQEMANVVIEMDANSEEAIEKVSNETLKVLNEKTAEFNKQTKHTFSLAIPTISYSVQTPGLGRNELIALVLGFLVGVGFAFLYEYLTDKASFESQIEEAIGVEIAGDKDMQKSLEKTLKNVAKIDLTKKLKDFDLEKENLILLIKLGGTRIKDLRYIKANSKAKLYPVITK